MSRFLTVLILVVLSSISSLVVGFGGVDKTWDWQDDPATKKPKRTLCVCYCFDESTTKLGDTLLKDVMDEAIKNWNAAETGWTFTKCTPDGKGTTNAQKCDTATNCDVEIRVDPNLRWPGGAVTGTFPRKGAIDRRVKKLVITFDPTPAGGFGWGVGDDEKKNPFRCAKHELSHVMRLDHQGGEFSKTHNLVDLAGTNTKDDDHTDANDPKKTDPLKPTETDTKHAKAAASAPIEAPKKETTPGKKDMDIETRAFPEGIVDGARIELHIPGTAFLADASVTLSRTSMLSMPSAWQPPEGYCRMIKGVHIDVTDLAGAGGILLDARTSFTIRIPYEDGTHAKIELADIEYGSLDERTLRPFYYDLAQEKWLPMDSVEISLDVERNLIEIVAPSGLLSTFRTAESPTTYTLYISLSARGCDCQGGGAQTLYWNLSTDPLSLDPSLATDTASQQVIKQLFGSLGQYDDKTMEVLPDLAKTWDLDAATNTWTFHLRDDVQWTDGSKVTASDVEYGIKRLLAHETASEYAYVLYLIKGAEAYSTGTGSAADVGVKVVDPVTVAITLNYPAACFPSIAALWFCAPLPQKAVEKYGDQWTEAKNIVTNGPYVLGEWVHDDHLILVKNPSYYDIGNVKIDQIYCYMVSEQSTAMAMYEAGKLSVNDNPPLVDLRRIKADPVLSKELNRAPLLSTYHYGFNAARRPLDNINVRKALASCVDRQALIDNVLKGNQRPAQTWTPPGIFGYVDGVALGIGYPYDPEKARQYLADAGYPGGVGFPEITLMFTTHQGQQETAEFIAQGWEDVLRIRVNLESQGMAVYFETLATAAPQVFWMGWWADYPDANNWLHEVFHSGSVYNYEKYSNPQFDALVEQAAVELNPAKRLELYKQAEILLCQTDVAFIPIYFYTRNVLTRPYVVRTFAAIGGEAWKNWCILPH